MRQSRISPSARSKSHTRSLPSPLAKSFRQPTGFRPLAFGQMELSGGSISHVFASETCAFGLINAVYLGDVEPGEMVIVSKDGMTRERYAPVREHSHCVFEHVYFARPDSFVFGRAVQESRELLGRRLSIEHPVDADIVVPVPDSGVALRGPVFRSSRADVVIRRTSLAQLVSSRAPAPRRSESGSSG